MLLDRYHSPFPAAETNCDWLQIYRIPDDKRLRIF